MKLPDSIVFSRDIVSDILDFFNRCHFSKVAVLVDDNTRKHCYSKIKAGLPEHLLIEISSGEEFKTLDTCQIIWKSLTDQGFDRKSLLVNLGGGVIGDMGGFCAATYKRGIAFVNIPTTLLSQVDASIGGKLGIDFMGFKNHIGVFQDPVRVFLHAGFFETLPEAEVYSGFAEVIKHCLIRDRKKFSEISDIPFQMLDLEELTSHSVKIKYDVVQEDPTEKGLRKILNFGHTIGHAIESHYLDKPGEKLLHGQAIAMGMVCEAFLSSKKLSLSEDELTSICSYILELYQLPAIPASEMELIAGLAKQDKKNEGNKIYASLLKNIGDCTINIPIDEEEILSSMVYYNGQISITQNNY